MWSWYTKNRLKLTTPKYYIFDIVDLNTHRKYNYNELISFCEKYELDVVPIEEVGDNFQYTQEELLVKATGKYSSGQNKEGIVIRPLVREYIVNSHSELSFKVINNEFLIKEK